MKKIFILGVTFLSLLTSCNNNKNLFNHFMPVIKFDYDAKDESKPLINKVIPSFNFRNFLLEESSITKIHFTTTINIPNTPTLLTLNDEEEKKLITIYDNLINNALFYDTEGPISRTLNYSNFSTTISYEDLSYFSSFSFSYYESVYKDGLVRFSMGGTKENIFYSGVPKNIKPVNILKFNEKDYEIYQVTATIKAQYFYNELNEVYPLYQKWLKLYS